MAPHLPYLVTVLAAAMVFFLMFKVGSARGKHGVKAPATTGHIEFEYMFRAHMNTIESMFYFLPLMWTFSIYISPLYAGILGLIWLIARGAYIAQYSRGKARTAPFVVNGTICLIYLAGSLFGIARAMFM